MNLFEPNHPAYSSGAVGKAFTLVELLIVLSIIALLLAILLPMLKQVRVASRASICLSNQRQIGVSFGVFLNDEEGLLPYAWLNSGAALAAAADEFKAAQWNSRLGPYRDSGDIMLCPNAFIDAGTIHYACNPALVGKIQTVTDAGNRRRLPHEKIGRFSEVILLTDTCQFRSNGSVDRDGRWFDNQFGKKYTPGAFDNEQPLSEYMYPNAIDGSVEGTPNRDENAGKYRLRMREAGADGFDNGQLIANFLFADFHAETLPPEDVVRRNWRPGETTASFFK